MRPRAAYEGALPNDVTVSNRVNLVDPVNGMRAIAVAVRESPCRGQCLDPTSGDRLFERYTTSRGQYSIGSGENVGFGVAVFPIREQLFASPCRIGTAKTRDRFDY